MVAHEYVKTPTAMADLILEIYEDEDSRLSSYASRMKLAFASRLMAMDACVDALRMRIKGGFALKLANVDSCLDVLQARISAADPRKILEKGYALTVDDKGVVMKGVAGREVGDRVSVLFADGTLDCEVVGIK